MTPKIADRLSKLIPRLASDADGEVLSTVRAIRASLQSEGLDLHDMAAAIGGVEIIVAARPATIAAAPTWKDLSHQERRAWMKIILDDPALGELEIEHLEEVDNLLRSGIGHAVNWRRARLFDERVARAHAQGRRA